MQLKSVPPKKVKTAPCQEVVLQGRRRRPDRLPGLQTWPDDGGVFHNFGLTHTKHPETGKRNLGLYRLQQHSPQHARHALADPQGLDRTTTRSPSGAASGCRSRSPSAATRSSRYAATAPLPGDIDEYLFAGFLRGERVEMVDCLTVPLQVPAHAAGRARGLAGAGRAAARGPVRRPHRLLHAGRAVPGAARSTA